MSKLYQVRVPVSVLRDRGVEDADGVLDYLRKMRNGLHVSEADVTVFREIIEEIRTRDDLTVAKCSIPVVRNKTIVDADYWIVSAPDPATDITFKYAVYIDDLDSAKRTHPDTIHTFPKMEYNYLMLYVA